VLGFVAGLLCGTNSLFSGRWMAAAKSPLTGTWGEANCGGTLAPAIKRCGYDGIFVRGASPHPVYICIEESGPSLRDASGLWGMDTVETDAALRATHPGCAAACIGPAGERRSLLAGISNDAGRLAARSGLGAVMGSKNLKAVALRGRQKVHVHDKDAMQHLSHNSLRWVRMTPPLPSGSSLKFIGTLMRILPFQVAQDGLLYKWMLRKWGTIAMNQMSVAMGDAPIQNWRGSDRTFPLRQSNSSDPDAIIRREVKKYHCRSCALGCGGVVHGPEGAESHKPEYETVLSWGGLLLNEDLDTIFAVNDRLNRAGMDSISAGATAAFAIECAERGLLKPEQTAGLDLRWGNSAALLPLVDQMIRREGLGALLADGTRAAALAIGSDAMQYAVQAGGQELAMHDGRNDPGFALHAVVEPMPGRHTNGSQLYYEMFQLWKKVQGLPKIKRLYSKAEKYRAGSDQAAAAVANSRFMQVINAAGLCLFGALVGVQRVPVFEWLNAACGWGLSAEDYLRAGARIQAIKQLFNARQGVPLRHAVNPRALGVPPLGHGANRGRTLPLDDMVRAYWLASGFDENTGMPTSAALRALDMEDEATALPRG
jgi:aldehyde:ferredoxin oxidoreductase